jgi:hypothetical protein
VRRSARNRPSVPLTCFPEAVLAELTAAGFVAVEAPPGPRAAGRVVVAEAAVEFANRLRVLARDRLLTGGRPESFRD